ncbi:replicative DNA helicase [Corynebacterium sp. A21]|uniref:replicative DNA helicase n=1 Tax=Corynebacterium sp. A21 TaxID=3457318 RepID=UPI003FD65921
MADLPHDEVAEQSVLGAMILKTSAIIDAVNIVKTGDFYAPKHQAIFQAIMDMFSDGTEIDAVLLATRLTKTGDIGMVGGAGYLLDLISMVPTASNAARYAEIVVEKATLRKALEAGVRIQQAATSHDMGAAEVVEMAQSATSSLTRTEQSDMESITDLLGPTLNEIDDIASGEDGAGIPTGFHDLDEYTNGLKGGQMIIVAARPGVGKSTIALDFMRNASVKHGKTSVVFSLEMSKSEIVKRLLSAETSIKLGDISSGKLRDEDWAKLGAKAKQLESAPIFIDDSSNLTMITIRAKARQLKQRSGLDMIVVDYLQLMSSGQRVESRQQEVSDFSRQLKLMAKELDVPVIAISQLNRGPESREDKRPQLADLRESGSLEQDADIVMLIHRPDSQDRDHPRAGEADIILAKHRGGPIGDVKIAHQLHYSRFANMAR